MGRIFVRSICITSFLLGLNTCLPFPLFAQKAYITRKHVSENSLRGAQEPFPYTE